MGAEINQMYSDEQLMAQSAIGDRKCFEMLYDRYSGKIYQYFLRMLWRDHELAEDQTQEIFLKIVHKPQLFDQNRPFKTWIYSVANNMCKNQYRHREVANKARQDMTVTSVESTSPISTDFDKKNFKTALDEALQNIDIHKRNAFILRFKHELSIKEIADITETAEGTVKSRIFYTLKELAKMLSEYNPHENHEKSR